MMKMLLKENNHQNVFKSIHHQLQVIKYNIRLIRQWKKLIKNKRA